MADPKAQLKELTDTLKRQEAKEGASGAVPNAQKRDLLDIEDIKAQHPDKHLRWCNINNPTVMANHLKKGYERLSTAQGGRLQGNQAVFAVPVERYQSNTAAEKARREGWLAIPDKEYEKTAEHVARWLRDEHGLRVNPESLIS